MPYHNVNQSQFHQLSRRFVKALGVRRGCEISILNLETPLEHTKSAKLFSGTPMGHTKMAGGEGGGGGSETLHRSTSLMYV